MTSRPLLTALAWRNLWRSRRRTFIILAAVGIGVWSIQCFTALMHAWSASTLNAGLMDLTGQGQIHAPGYRDDPGVARSMPPPGEPLEALLDGRPVARWAARVRVPAVIRSEYRTAPVTLVGIEPARERGLSFVADAVSRGRYLSGPDDGGILVGRKLAGRLRTGIGRRVVVMTQGADGKLAERGFPVAGTFAASPRAESGYAFTGRETAQAMLGLGDRVSEIAFDLHDMAGLPAFVRALRAAAPGREVEPWTVLTPLTAAMTRLSGSFVTMWIVIMFVLMGFGIVNTLLMALYERTRELGLLQALGMRPRLIVAQVVLESALLVGLGVAAGTLGAVATILPFRGGLDLGFVAAGAQWLGAGRVLYPRLSPGELARIGMLIWTLGVTVTLWPSWRAVRRVPIDAINRT